MNPNDVVLRLATRSFGGEARYLRPPDRWTAYSYSAMSFISYGMRLPFDSPVSIERANDKLWSRCRLAEARLPIVDWVLIDSQRITDLPKQGLWVLKIIGGAKGRGVRVRLPAERLREHIQTLHTHSRFQFLEPYLLGKQYRVLVLDGRALGLSRREMPSVIGDGKSNIQQLMYQRYSQSVLAYSEGFQIDEEVRDCLSLQGFGAESILAPGQTVVTSLVSNASRGSVVSRIETTDSDKELIDIAIRAASIIGLRLAGVDLVVGKDHITILEVNPSPGIVGHSLDVERECVDLHCAQQILFTAFRWMDPAVVLPKPTARYLSFPEFVKQRANLDYGVTAASTFTGL